MSVLIDEPVTRNYEIFRIGLFDFLGVRAICKKIMLLFLVSDRTCTSDEYGLNSSINQVIRFTRYGVLLVGFVDVWVPSLGSISLLCDFEL